MFGAEGVNGVVPTTDTAGTLRLPRSGSTLGGYFWNGHDKKTIGVGGVSTSDFTVRLEVWTDERFFTGQAVEVAFTNPQISSEAFVRVLPIGDPTVPEPSTYIAGALLLLPFGAQAVRHLRNRKQAA